MKEKRWFEIKLVVPGALEEAITNRLFELGAEGVNQQLTPDTEPVLSGFFAESVQAAALTQLREYLASLAALFPQEKPVRLECQAVDNQDWAERYKEFYRPQPLGHCFYLAPAWEKNASIPDGRIPIIMEPGQAFGTGLHASTQLCISLIERVIKQQPHLTKLTLMDVGTGTGILAIAAYKLGIPQVSAIDNDPIAVETAQENIALNHCTAIQVSSQPLSAFREPFDIVVSNILLETHKELIGEYARLVKSGGQLILSGLLTPQKEEMDHCFSDRGFTLELSESWQEWLALMYIRQGNATA